MSKYRPRRSDAPLVVSMIALIVALGGTGYAALVVPAKSVGPKQLKRNAVTKPKLKNSAVTGAKLQDDAVGETKLQDGAVGGTKLEDGAVSGRKLQDSAVGGTKLQDGAVSGRKLQDKAVSGTKLEDKAVTASKLGDAAVTSTAIQPGAVEAQALAPNAVTTSSIEPQSLTAGAFAPGTLAETAALPSSYTGVAANDTWTFYGESNQVNVTAGQSIIGQAQALPATPPGSPPQVVFYGMCYQSSADANPKPMGRTAATPDNLWGNVYAGDSAQRVPFVAVGAVASPAAGAYEVGFCVNNPSGVNEPLALAHANEVVGWSQATN